MAAGWAKMCGSWSREATQKEVALNLGRNPERLWWLLTWLEIPNFFSKKWNSTIDLSCFFLRCLIARGENMRKLRWRFSCRISLHTKNSCGLQNFNYSTWLISCSQADVWKNRTWGVEASLRNVSANSLSFCNLVFESAAQFLQAKEIPDILRI